MGLGMGLGMGVGTGLGIGVGLPVLCSRSAHSCALVGECSGISSMVVGVPPREGAGTPKSEHESPTAAYTSVLPSMIAATEAVEPPSTASYLVRVRVRVGVRVRGRVRVRVRVSVHGVVPQLPLLLVHLHHEHLAHALGRRRACLGVHVLLEGGARDLPF